MLQFLTTSPETTRNSNFAPLEMKSMNWTLDGVYFQVNLQLSAVNPISNLSLALVFINWNAVLRASKLQVPKLIFGRISAELYDSKLDSYRLQMRWKRLVNFQMLLFTRWQARSMEKRLNDCYISGTEIAQSDVNMTRRNIFYYNELCLVECGISCGLLSSFWRLSTNSNNEALKVPKLMCLQSPQ